MQRHLALAATIVLARRLWRGEGSTGPSTGLHVAGASVSDTVLARPVQALVVEVPPTSGSSEGLSSVPESAQLRLDAPVSAGDCVHESRCAVFSLFAS